MENLENNPKDKKEIDKSFEEITINAKISCENLKQILEKDAFSYEEISIVKEHAEDCPRCEAMLFFWCAEQFLEPPSSSPDLKKL